MDSRTGVVLTLLGLLSTGTCRPAQGDMVDWIAAQENLIKNLQGFQKFAETQQSGLEALEGRLNATEDELSRQKTELDQLKKEKEDLQTRLGVSESEIDKLRQREGKAAPPPVAFSVSLSNHGEIYSGPCTDKTLIFKRVFSNVGGAYNENTGIFTAPHNALYYFSFSTYGYNTHTSGAVLVKNGVRQISTYEQPTVDGSDSGSNSVALRLVAGDQVHVELWDDGRVFDNLNGHTTFSGFLLFPV